MKLNRQWKYIMARAWSVRLMLASAILGAVGVSLPLFSEIIPREVFAGLSMLTAILAAVVRVIDQPGMDRRKQDVPVSIERRQEEL